MYGIIIKKIIKGIRDGIKKRRPRKKDNRIRHPLR